MDSKGDSCLKVYTESWIFLSVYQISWEYSATLLSTLIYGNFWPNYPFLVHARIYKSSRNYLFEPVHGSVFIFLNSCSFQIFMSQHVLGVWTSCMGVRLDCVVMKMVDIEPTRVKKHMKNESGLAFLQYASGRAEGFRGQSFFRPCIHFWNLVFFVRRGLFWTILIRIQKDLSVIKVCTKFSRYLVLVKVQIFQ